MAPRVIVVGGGRKLTPIRLSEALRRVLRRF